MPSKRSPRIPDHLYVIVSRESPADDFVRELPSKVDDGGVAVLAALDPIARAQQAGLEAPPASIEALYPPRYPTAPTLDDEDSSNAR